MATAVTMVMGMTMMITGGGVIGSSDNGEGDDYGKGLWAVAW